MKEKIAIITGIPTYVFLTKHVSNSVVGVVLSLGKKFCNIYDCVPLVLFQKLAILRILLGVHLIMEYYFYEERLIINKLFFIISISLSIF